VHYRVLPNAKAAPGVEHRFVSNASRPSESLVAVLTIDLAEEPVGGILARERHADRAFSGWFELIGFLEEAVRIARQTSIDASQRIEPVKGKPFTDSERS
jgi:hypothetical protein